MLDTNILIYLMRNQLPPAGLKVVSHYQNEGRAAISIITEIETLGFHNGKPADWIAAEKLISTLHSYSLSDEIKDRTVDLRRKYNTKLPDAVIAATALVHNLTLISRNDKDFLKISDLDYVNPFSKV